MTTVSISLIGANGDDITLGTDASETDYILGKSVSGFGLTGLSVNIVEGAGDGGKYLSTRRLSRDVDLPIYVIGDDRADVETKLRRLGRLLSDRSGATRILASFSDATEYYLDGYLITGGNVTYGDDAGKDYALWAIQLRCPQPYWTSTNPTTVTLDDTEMTDVNLVNDGDIDTPLFIEITGEITDVQFQNSNGFILYEDIIASGEVITIDCSNATVTNDFGVNKYSSLGPAPKMITVPRGTTVLQIDATSPQVGSSIVLTYYERRELIF
jgi:phage-related protein